MRLTLIRCSLYGTPCFNSRTLGRVRQCRQAFLAYVHQFQFTHPGKGATFLSHRVNYYVVFQFTHPGKGATPLTSPTARRRISFNSRTLGRVRPTLRRSSASTSPVSIHAPWEGCDRLTTLILCEIKLFQFTHPGKGATSAKSAYFFSSSVSIHAPWEGCDVSVAH